MTTLSTWVLGAGGQARETVDLIAAVQRDQEGRLLQFEALVGADDEAALAECTGALVLGVGFPNLRHTLQARFVGGGQFVFPTLVHPAADVGSRCDLAEGVVVSAGCVVTADVRLGTGTLLNPRSGIGHDTVVGQWCVVNPGANISGSVILGDAVLIGSGATVLQGLTIGDGAVVGAGAVVIRDVPPGATVVGVPARAVRGEETA